ncbi:hypothetical protein H9Q10_08005 [Eikenella sp. S3360]|uniref:Uncharacterized protein n=1 Tax=Eikenella glucosivorans TaxID=2766967 RepID=A0ABS0NBB9_9NEIS|nr:hypothetical protein [Eikenella glucosivorans]MBH5329608.1 hypothetical protein [Eikenella glucosivorans]
MQNQANSPPSLIGRLVTVMGIIPCGLFMTKYGRHGSAAWLYLTMLGGAGLLSALIIGLLAKKLKLQRDLRGIVIFVFLGAVVGYLLAKLVFYGISFGIVLIFHLPLSAFLNGALLTFMYAMAALAAGLVAGCFLLPKHNNGE